MASDKVLSVAICLMVCIVYVTAMPGGHSSSYQVIHLDGHGDHGLKGDDFGGIEGGFGGEDESSNLQESHDHHPSKYSYKYGVEDKHTGDYKEAKEDSDGDVIHGEYSLLQPDGRKRIVTYTATKHGGFNAHVTYVGHAVHPEHHK